MDSIFLGTINNFGFPFTPVGYAKCDGTLMSINENNALYALLGTAYGGDGRSTFGLPNLQGRVGISQGTDTYSGQTYQMGEYAGSTQIALTMAQLPTHSHQATFTAMGSTDISVNLSLDDATSATPIDNGYLATTVATGGVQDKPENIYRADAGIKGTVNLGGVNMGGGGGTVTIDNNGASSPFSLMQPYLVSNFCINTKGLFPSRN